MEWLIFGFLVIMVIGAFVGPGKCGVCGVGLKKKSYTWKVDGKNQKLCPKCNSQMERKVSKEAFSKKFG